MIPLFEEKIDLSNITCHSGGAEGSDLLFETLSSTWGVKTRAYSYKTDSHKSTNKVEISDSEYQEGIKEINKANKHLNRYGIHKYMNLLARNWPQVKYSTQIFAVGVIVEPKGKTPEGYYSKSNLQTVSGGTGYAIMMGILHQKEIFVFDQSQNFWYRWSYTSGTFVKLKECPKISSQNFAGIGTRKLNDNGKRAIADLFENTFRKD